MTLRSKLQELSEKKYIGRIESFDYVYIGLLIYWLGENAPKSRAEISNFLALGEGSVRTMLRRLKEKDVVCIAREGVYLSHNGSNFFSKMKANFPILKEGSFGLLSLGRSSVIIRIDKRKERVLYGIEQRDEAIRYGAKGAITLIYEKGHFIIPGEGEDCEAFYPHETWENIRMSVNPKNGDIIIICSSESIQKAYLGCLAAALTLYL
jgi:DNA-binding Lrp family transcriptional regulator